MTDEQFCKIESAISGEPIDNIEQLVSKTFTGRELKEYLEEAFALHSVRCTCSGCDWIDIDYKVRKCIKCNKTEQFD